MMNFQGRLKFLKSDIASLLRLAGLLGLILVFSSSCLPGIIPFVVSNRTNTPIQVKIKKASPVEPTEETSTILPGQRGVVWMQRMSNGLCSCCTDGLATGEISIKYPNGVVLDYSHEQLKREALFLKKDRCEFLMEVVLQPQIEKASPL